MDTVRVSYTVGEAAANFGSFNQLWFLPHQLHGLLHQFSIGFGVFRLRNGHVDPS